MLAVDPDASAFAPDLFNTEPYSRLHAAGGEDAVVRSVYRRGGYGAPAGVFQALQMRPGVFASPGRGSYGGFDMDPALRPGEIAEFVAEAEAALLRARARRVELVLPPFCYRPGLAAQILPLLCGRGYVVTRQELNQAVGLAPGSLAGQASYAVRKSLSKAHRAGVVVRQLGDGEHRDGYDAIVENRRRKGRTLSMSWADVQAMLSMFPDRMHLFGAEQDGSLLAAAICLAVNTRVFYVYAWGEIAGLAGLSPVTALASHLYDFARGRGFELLDLGTSSVGGVVNPGLHAFKRSLGATPSLKLWLARDFP